MNPFIYPNFWLSLAFILILGLVIFSPVQKSIVNFFKVYQKKIQSQIDESDHVHQEALMALKEIQKQLKMPQENVKIKQEIYSIQKEFLQKTDKQLSLKKQDFERRKNLMILEAKNHLKKQFLDMAEEKIFHQHLSEKTKNQEVDHFIKMLHKDKDELKKLIFLS